VSGRTIYWRCFHCGEGFTKAQERWAREHFGRDEDKEPVCLIRTAGESSLLTALRNAQDELDLSRANTDDSDVVRAMVAMQADHSQSLIREEERGYAKGLADGRAEVCRLTADNERLRAALRPMKQAADMADWAVKQNPNRPESWIDLAQSWLNKSEFKAARSALNPELEAEEGL
jgi:hypothetical protein